MPPSRKPGAAAGLAFALAAYASWGVFPVYFHALAGVPPLEVLGHRVLWSALFLSLLISLLRRWEVVAGLLRDRRRLATLVASAALVSANWLLFIWAVTSGHILESSLGYFMNPLVNVLLGVVFLREPLSRLQAGAVALATGGVLWLVVAAGHLPWISLLLALTFGAYGLVRKRSGVDPVAGLFVETLVLAPLAGLVLAWLARAGAGHFGRGTGHDLLLASSGIITALPLIWFAMGVQRLRLSTAGLLQYVSPTLQFTCAVALYGERFTRDHAVAFACIWTSLALYSGDAFRALRRAEAAPADT
jgi:chloramphenicol-sensitive protein RarD